VYLGTESLTLTIRPADGGSLSELSVRAVPLNLLDTLTRRPEVYHDPEKTRPQVPPSERVRTIHESLPGKAALSALGYDRHRRVSFLEALLAPSADLAAWDRGEGTALHDFATTRWWGEVKEEGDSGLSIILRPVDPSAVPVGLEKTVSFEAGKQSVTFQYAVRSHAPLRATLTSHWNLALTAGEAPGRYFELPGRPSLAAEGESEGTRIVLVDEWIGLRVELACHRPARIHYAPIHTISLSEAGFEQIYQGTSLVVGWPLALAADETWHESLTVTVFGR
jgi:alpha-amylase